MAWIKNLKPRLKALWNPEMYHGWSKENTYFEGWYYKVISADEKHAFAFIPGISKGMDGRHHSFVQVLDGKNCTTKYLDFEVEDFVPNEEKFEVNIKDNLFTRDQLKLTSDFISADLSFSKQVNWPKQLGAPGIMGWYAFMPFMQCYHDVVSMNHEISGTITYQNEVIDFNKGKGYMEKDWGVSFPKCWIWMQSNHFDNNDEPISCCSSIAHVPWMGSYFVGFIVGLLYKGEVIKFATYTGAKKTVRIEGDEVFLSFKNRKYLLKIHAIKKGAGTLISPLSGAMTGKVDESLQSIMKIELYQGSNLLYKGTGRNAGLEIAGEVDILLTD